MTIRSCPHSLAQRVSAAIAVVFGIVSLIAGGRILLGLRDPGYAIVPPVLLFNTVMGAVYVGSAALIVRAAEYGRIAAAVIAFINLAVLLALGIYRWVGGVVAVETFVAMAARTAVWFAIMVALSPRPRRDAAPPAEA